MADDGRVNDSVYVASGPRVAIRPFTPADGEEFTARARESAVLHRPWLFPPTTADAYAAYYRGLTEEPSRTGFLVCEHGGAHGGGEGRGNGGAGRIAGFVTVYNIVHGAFLCGALGYGAFAHAAGRGLLGEGLGLVIGHAFGPLGLHRLEANIQPGNERSIALVRGHGFRREGFSPSFVLVDGVWRDHERWAITSDMVS
jgi:ribosomal-protein-alanine N-acetyltransferase